MIEVEEACGERRHDVVLDELEATAAGERTRRSRPAGVEVVEADHPMALLDEMLAKVRAEKARAACDEDAEFFASGHARLRR